MKSLIGSAFDYYRENGVVRTAIMILKYCQWRLSALVFGIRHQSSIDGIGSGLKIRGDVRVGASRDAKISIGDNVEIAGNFGRSTILRIRGDLKISDEVFINRGCEIYSSSRVNLGYNATIAPNVVIRDSDMHGVGEGDINKGPVNIGQNVWIGTGTIVLKGVTIGDNTVIGAGSVVTHDIPPKTLAAGVPASPIREIE